jgi:hypothetical protein
VLSGLNEGQEIVTGPYKTLRDLKGGSLLKRDTANFVVPQAEARWRILTKRRSSS